MTEEQIKEKLTFFLQEAQKLAQRIVDNHEVLEDYDSLSVNGIFSSESESIKFEIIWNEWDEKMDWSFLVRAKDHDVRIVLMYYLGSASVEIVNDLPELKRMLSYSLFQQLLLRWRKIKPRAEKEIYRRKTAREKCLRRI